MHMVESMPEPSVAHRTTSSAGADPSRVYSSKGHQQTRFPPRRRIAVPSRKMRRSALPGKTESQQTMTQIGFIQRSFSSDQMEDPIPADSIENDDGEDDMSWVPNKRRRIRRSDAGDGERDSQPTLTQGHFFVADSFEEETVDRLSDAASRSNRSYLDGANDEQMDDVENMAPQSTRMHEPIPPEPSRSSSMMPGSQRNRAVFKMPATPRRLSRREVPSSQSPAGTPLSMQGTPCQRTPLGEMTKNLIKHRDSSPTFRSSQSAKARKAIDYQLDEQNDENWDPCSNITKPVSSKRKRQPSPDFSEDNVDFGMDGASDFEYPQQLQIDFSSPYTGSRTQHARTSLPDPHAMARSSQASTVDATQHSPTGWPGPVKQEPASNFELFAEDDDVPSSQNVFQPDTASSSRSTSYFSVQEQSSGHIDTQDVTSVSQLLPASLVRDMRGGF